MSPLSIRQHPQLGEYRHKEAKKERMRGILIIFHSPMLLVYTPYSDRYSTKVGMYICTYICHSAWEICKITSPKVVQRSLPDRAADLPRGT